MGAAGSRSPPWCRCSSWSCCRLDGPPTGRARPAGLRRRPRLARAVRHGASASCSCCLPAWAAGRRFIRSSRLTVLPAAPLPQAQAIVVLSAGRIRRSPGVPQPSGARFPALERITYAALVAGRPVAAAGHRRPAHRPRFRGAAGAGHAAHFEEDYGLPVRWIETGVAQYGRKRGVVGENAKAAQITRIILVTDAMHMRRARLAFERQGIAVTLPGTDLLPGTGPP